MTNGMASVVAGASGLSGFQGAQATSDIGSASGKTVADSGRSLDVSSKSEKISSDSSGEGRSMSQRYNDAHAPKPEPIIDTKILSLNKV